MISPAERPRRIHSCLQCIASSINMETWWASCYSTKRSWEWKSTQLQGVCAFLWLKKTWYRIPYPLIAFFFLCVKYIRRGGPAGWLPASLRAVDERWYRVGSNYGCWETGAVYDPLRKKVRVDHGRRMAIVGSFGWFFASVLKWIFGADPKRINSSVAVLRVEKILVTGYRVLTDAVNIFYPVSYMNR